MGQQQAAAPAAGPAGGAAPGTTRPKKRAVVMIHGMGSQSPMETLRGLVQAVWTSVPALGKSGKALTWSQRDRMSDNLELWRITTNSDTSGVRTDFFEFYWADMMEDTKLSSVVSWLVRLFVRSPKRVPPAVMVPWLAGWVGAIIFLLIFLLGYYFGQKSSIGSVGGVIAGIVAAGIAAAIGYFRTAILVAVVGDAARYLTAAPPNIAARTRIRLAGLQLLRALHEDDGYDRVILVCHSLGTVVGYDLINFYWSDINDRIEHAIPPRSPVLTAIDAASRALRDNPEDPARLEAYRNAQRDYFAEIRRVAPDVWKVSDFVTLGSPLTHGHFLLVDDGEPLFASEEKAIDAPWIQCWWSQLDEKTKAVAAFFRARAAQRELTLCPPLTEYGDEFTFDPKRGAFVVPHHAAPFAPVCWTNVYAPRRHLLWGDVVGGPVAPLFGPGVKDVPLVGEASRSFIAHTRYWDLGYADDAHLQALRAALNYANADDTTTWAMYEQTRTELQRGEPPQVVEPPEAEEVRRMPSWAGL